MHNLKDDRRVNWDVKERIFTGVTLKQKRSQRLGSVSMEIQPTSTETQANA
jgi:hypothetical protein